ncbi:ImmA/IrrE family metallo-endopeptidase [Rothia sp. CCM 9418]|uniref:ImmA/IrrE family metallo-endopeptidase n=1 Tax=Rothia sp. CCM 9418 TaxID=3402661 RepID=UPI003AE7FC07
MNSITTHITNAKEHAKKLGINIYYDPLKPELRGLYLPKTNSIFIQPNQHPHMENWVLWHEIGHYHSRSSHISTKAERKHIELCCDKYASKCSIPIESISDTRLYSDDFSQWAYNLCIPPKVLKIRLAYLTQQEILALPTDIYNAITPKVNK